MCLIIYRPSGIETLLPEAHLEQAWTRNKDGGGLMWRDGDGVVKYEKGYFEKDLFFARIRALEVVRDLDLAIHCRIKTTGDVNKENCHPFVTSHGVTVMHNGVLPYIVPYDFKGSDTAWFVERILSTLTDRWMFNEDVLRMADHITEKSRMLYFHSRRIYKSGDWKEENGVYYSNDNYKPCVVVTNTYSYPSDYTYNNGKRYSKDKTEIWVQGKGWVRGDNGVWIKGEKVDRDEDTKVLAAVKVYVLNPREERLIANDYTKVLRWLSDKGTAARISYLDPTTNEANFKGVVEEAIKAVGVERYRDFDDASYD